MSDGYAGIAVPEGSVGELRSAGSRLAQQAQMLVQASDGLRGMPASAGSWTGPAQSAYANRCITASRAALMAAQAFITAAGAAEAYADELEDAKRDAREAIRDARAAQKRIDRAEEGIDTARGRQITAQGRIDAALHAQAVTAMSPGADGGVAEAMLREATAELQDAQEDERRWVKLLREAKDDLREAKRRGERAEQAAKDAATAAQTLFAAAGASMPVLALPGLPAAKAKVNDDRPWYEKAADWSWKQVKAVPGAAKDSTVALGTGLYDMVYNGLEYRYNQIFDPSAAMQYELETNRAFTEAVTNPIATGKQIVNWDDLSNGRIGEWVGGMAPDAVIATLTAGGGTMVRTAQGTRKVSEMSGDTSIAKAQAAYDRAVAAHGDLAPPSKFGGKTVAATKKPSLSGWTHGEMPGFEYIRPEEVKRMADDMDFEIRGGGAADHAG
ncbi:MAG TPA: hypothetical protein VD836_12890, partial [Solirubrobacteraceae bacterium]|nr:hypothetical protein [Solirubrobacteraceae bacterium]